MNYPAEVQRYIDRLDEYQLDDNETQFDILHLYPHELAYPAGFYDSRFFQLVGFNTRTKKKAFLGEHDGLNFNLVSNAIDVVRIYADGSTMIRCNCLVKISSCQEAFIYPSEE
jgi:hypothetical protein